MTRMRYVGPEITVSSRAETEPYPCDDACGHCGWLHYRYTGRTIYHLNGQEVSQSRMRQVEDEILALSVPFEAKS